MTRHLLDHDHTRTSDGPANNTVLLLHAGVADRRMWADVRAGLGDDLDLVVPDLRGFGRSDLRPAGPWTHAGDVVDLLDALEPGAVHVVGASLGAGVGVELALERPDLVASLALIAPGGSLIPRMTEQLRAFVAAEDAALGAGDLDAAASVNVDWWLVGPHRDAHDVPAADRELVHAMQRRAFELTADWPDLEQPPEHEPLERLAEIGVPTLVLAGALDLDAIAQAADAVVAGIPGASRVDWPDVAHLPSLERPSDLADLLVVWREDRLRHRPL